ncbi:MAG: hypothetical protein M5U12_22190 [Verrucomicrobia bacterium]|nr:hypothetical protein [Verrucomicrobiota bacterium]
MARALVVTLVVASVVAACRIAVARGTSARGLAVALATGSSRTAAHHAMELLLQCPEELRHGSGVTW